MRSSRRVAIVIIVSFLLTGLWSSQVLPGSVFYGYKISVNDPAVKLLIITQERKSNFEVDLVEERLGEVTRLIRENRLDDKSYTAWLQGFTLSMYTVRARLDSLEELNRILLAHSIAVEYNSVIHGHAIALPFLPVSNGEDVEKVSSVLQSHVVESLAGAKRLWDVALQTLPPQQFIGKIEGQITSTENYATETGNILSAVESRIAPDIFNNLREMLNGATVGIAKAKDSRARDFYPQAALEVQEAHGISRQIRVAVSALAPQ